MYADIPRRSSRRRPDLNIDTSPPTGHSRSPVASRGRSREPAPAAVPQTPPSNRNKLPPPTSLSNRKASSRALRGPSLTRNADDSFLDNPDSPDSFDMSENKENDNPDLPRPRDSHDLSLSPRNVTRDSLMTNMLISLDQFSMGGPVGGDFGNGRSMFGDPSQHNPYDTDDNMPRPVRGGRSNGHGYSYSSDFDADDASRISSRGRRSNSSSNFQSGLHRISSMRESMRSTPGTPRHMHSRGGKGSTKSSSSNSIDAGYAQVLSSTRWASGFGGRSSSFDYGHRPPAALQATQQQQQQQQQQQHYQPQPQQQGQAPWHIEFSNTFFNDDYDAAPTPTVPGGPRRIVPQTPPTAMYPRSPVAAPVADDELEPPAVILERKSTNRSAKSTATSRKADHKPNNNHEEVPPLPAAAPVTEPSPVPALDIDSAPAPHVGYGKTKEAVHGAPIPTHTPKKSVSADEVPPVPAPAALEPPMPPLVAPIQLPITKDKLSAKPEPSPISSLRRVMNPYLKGSPLTPNTPITPQSAPVQATDFEMAPDPHDEGSAEEHPRSFSPEYDPSPNARIRQVRSRSRGEDRSPSDHERRTDTPTRPPPEPPVSNEKRNNSFLDIDGSDNEADTESRQRGKTRKEKGHRQDKPSKESSPSRRPSQRRDDTTIRGRKTNRLTVDTTDSDDEGNKSGLILPIEGTRSASRTSGSTTTDYKSAASAAPSVRVEPDNSPKVLGTFESMNAKPLDEPEFVVGDPTDDDRQKAQKIFDGNEDFIQKEKAAAWMGEEGPIRQRTLRAYMDLYDFTNKSILQSLRLICERLVFRAETQQVDRILVAFSKRWCDCNTNHGFKASDVIHTICYSIMLLNTDLHLADIDQKMTRSQFVKNTMTTITQAVAESAPEAFERPTILPGKTNSSLGGDDSRPSIEERFVSRRLSFRPPPRNEDGSSDFHDECGPLVKAPFDGSMRAWESQVEIVLKDIYTSIRDERLPLFGADPSKNLTPTTNSLSVIGMLKRTPSMEFEEQVTTSYGQSGILFVENELRGRKFDLEPFGFVGDMEQALAGQNANLDSIGFANALSQAIIRDDESAFGKAASIMSDELKSAQLLEDESLELAGPPWVKEGIVIHKHHLDGIDKKAKDRHWNEVFAVVQKGQMSIFSFGTAKSSVGRKSRGRNAKGPAVVGGGNWQDNATNLGTFSLRQTLASALPPPGYSRARPHVWALSLPSGAVHLFQVGTPEISKEFVTTANYWSARLSTHPLVGGISNIEYGWSDAIINNALVTAINEQATGQSPGRNSRPGSSTANPRPSFSSGTFRSGSIDHGSGGAYGASRGAKLPGDRITISDWAPPAQSMRPSNLPEEEQLESLTSYVKGIEDELQTHNQLRSPMLLAFTPRGNNANKAMANWERKSAYLLREIVKFRTYVDCLQQATTRKNEIYSERDLARRAARGELDEGEIEFDVPHDATIRA
ncbi:PH and SEC7 domain-containing protein [Colletotrichum sp. SAR 10_71]|nr:PH and SEC7 domain-containing protein [Colletotrichum sp. SAR 10_71]KAI8192158.1 PH and SEC7 domain-containing protein [Colletotrichum sp. SAR 10_75]